MRSAKTTINRRALVLHSPSDPKSDWDFFLVVDAGRADEQPNTCCREEHQRQEVRVGDLHDGADDNRYANAADIAAQIHQAAEEADLVAGAENRRDAPVQT